MVDQEIFLSWSKSASHTAAEAFREYLPQLLTGVKPWMSSLDIAKGTAWFGSISAQLARSRACLLLITPENIGSPWLYYEAGAVAHAFSGTRVFPYLLGLKAGDLGATPLGQYQVTLFDRDDTKKLIHDLNATLETPIDETLLNSAFDGVWPKLYRKLNKIPFTKAILAPVAPAPPLSELATRILLAAVAGKQSKVFVNSSMHGQNISAGDTRFIENSNDDRTNAQYRAAVDELLNRRLVEDRWGKGEVLPVTSTGFTVADEAKRLLPPELSAEVKAILRAIGDGKDGQVMTVLESEGFHVYAGGKNVITTEDDSVRADYESAIEEMVNSGFLRIQGEDNYQLTKAGYQAAKNLTVN